MQNLTQMLMQQWGRGDVSEVFNRHSLMLTSSAMLAMLLVGCKKDDNDSDATVAEIDLDFQLDSANGDGTQITVEAKVSEDGGLSLQTNDQDYQLQMIPAEDIGGATAGLVYDGSDSSNPVPLGVIGYNKVSADSGITAANLVQIEGVALEVPAAPSNVTYWLLSESAEGGAALQIIQHAGDDWTTGWSQSDLPVGEGQISVTFGDGDNAVTYEAKYENGKFEVLQQNGETTDFVFYPVIQEYVMDSGSLTVVNYTIYETQEDLDSQNSLGAVSLMAVTDDDDGTEEVNILMGQSFANSTVLSDPDSGETYIFSALEGSGFTLDQAVKFTVNDDSGNAVAVVDLVAANYDDGAYAIVQIGPAEGIANIVVDINAMDFPDANSHSFIDFVSIYSDQATVSSGDPLAYVGSVVDTEDKQLMLGILEPQADTGIYTGLTRFENDEGEKEVDGYVWMSYDGTNFKTTMVHDTVGDELLSYGSLGGGFDSDFVREYDADYNFQYLDLSNGSFPWDHFARYDESGYLNGVQFNHYVDDFSDDGRALSITQNGADGFEQLFGDGCQGQDGFVPEECTVKNGDLLSFSYGFDFATDAFRDGDVLPMNGDWEYTLSDEMSDDNDIS